VESIPWRFALTQYLDARRARCGTAAGARAREKRGGEQAVVRIDARDEDGGGGCTRRSRGGGGRGGRRTQELLESAPGLNAEGRRSIHGGGGGAA
jgi:hypothetical protein